MRYRVARYHGRVACRVREGQARCQAGGQCGRVGAACAVRCRDVVADDGDRQVRLAVEEAWVELTQSAGQETARLRVEQVREALVGHYRELHDGIVEQRRDHLESQTKFERLRAEFHDERQKLMEWISTRDQELQIGEERLRLAATDASMRDSAWQAARDRWMEEKAEAEQVIRKLLAELGNQHRDPLLVLNELSSLGMSAIDGQGTMLIASQPESID